MKNVSWGIFKIIFIGIIYLISIIIIGIVLSVIGFEFPETTEKMNILLFKQFIAGIVVGISLWFISLNINNSKVERFIIFISLLVGNFISVVVEGYFFVPELINNELVIPLLLQQLLLAFIVAMVSCLIFTNKNNKLLIDIKVKHSIFNWIWKIIVCSLIYVVLYYIFGKINYALFTNTYYEGIYGLNTPSQGVILKAELIRGFMIVLSVVLLIRNIKCSKRRSRLIVGIVIFSIGGIVPLIQQINMLPLVLIVMSSIEIFFQNFFTGIFAVQLIDNR